MHSLALRSSLSIKKPSSHAAFTSTHPAQHSAVFTWLFAQQGPPPTRICSRAGSCPRRGPPLALPWLGTNSMCSSPPPSQFLAMASRSSPLCMTTSPTCPSSSMLGRAGWPAATGSWASSSSRGSPQPPLACPRLRYAAATLPQPLQSLRLNNCMRTCEQHGSAVFKLHYILRCFYMGLFRQACDALAGKVSTLQHNSSCLA